jgi:hypothetical protein
MGWEPLDLKHPETQEIIGDKPFDQMADAIERIASIYQDEIGRKPTVNELVTTFRKALATRIDEVAQEGEDHELSSITFRLKKIPKRQQYRLGDILKGKLADGENVYGRLFEIDPGVGPKIGVYDSKGIDPRNIKGILNKPLIVKIIPIHRELLQDRSEWLVIGNQPISDVDDKLPRGPLIICGDNNHLIAANYYYGLSKEASQDVDKWLVKRTPLRGREDPSREVS